MQKDESEGEIWYFYDTAGKLLGFELDDREYFYELNEQDDVIGILDSNGKRIVQYYYDAWGKIIEINGDKNIGNKNPFRYHSYYYDNESGFYYLTNRYYDPELKRMISKDSYSDTNFGVFCHNMYAYCENTPINATNTTGNIPSWVKKLDKSESGYNYYWKDVDLYYDTNCYGYAIGDLEYKNPGDYSGKSLKHNLTTVVNNTKADLKSRGFSVSSIPASSVKYITSSYTVIAVRTGKIDGDWDYHFMKRRINSDGKKFWAHKPGQYTKMLIHAYSPGKLEKWPAEYYTTKWKYATGGYSSSTKYIMYC